jgi:putative addiction module component (TIGR02574 family)
MLGKSNVEEIMSAVIEPVKSVEQVFIEALSLPMPARADLAERLINSLVGSECDFKQEWMQEALARCKAMDEGRLKVIPAKEAMRELRDGLKSAK